MSTIYSFLEKHAITYKKYEHPAVFTCEESEALPPMPGNNTKNLFIKDKKGQQYFLVVVGHEKSVDLKKLGETLGVKGLRFANEVELMQYLGVTPGSATMLGLMHDTETAVTVIIDQSLWQAESLQCHPLVNTGTLVIPHNGIEAFLQATGHTPNVMDVPAR